MIRNPALLFPLALLGACGGSDAPPAPVNHAIDYASRCGLPDGAAEPYRTAEPTGPHCVGAAEYFVADGTRPETLGEGAQGHRSLQVRVLYPAVERQAVDRMPYAGEEVYADIGWWPAGLRPQGHAWRHAPPAIGQPAPVILFSPGLDANTQAYAGLTEDLASHGYVVVTVNHPYISGVTLLPGGGLAHNEHNEDGSDELLEVALADGRAVLGWLAEQNGARHALLEGKLDLGRIGAYGHSFGGATALQLQRTDSRVKAAVNLDGSVYGRLDEPWTKPWMVLQGVYMLDGVPFQDDTVAALWNSRQGPAHREVMAGACHGDFGDAARLVARYNARNPSAPVELPSGLFCTKDADALERGVRARVLDFFARYLR